MATNDSHRKPGSMAGEIWIADDFDKLPDDIAASFGACSASDRTTLGAEEGQKDEPNK